MQDVIQMPDLAYLIVLAGTISLRPMALRRTSVLAAGSLALGLAALPAGAHPVTAGLLLLAALVAAVVAIRAGWRGLPLAAGALLVLWISRGVVIATGVTAALLGVLAIAAIAAVLLWLTHLLRRRPRAPLAPAAPGTLLPLLIPGLLLAALGSHLSVVLLGPALLSWTAWLMVRPAGFRRWPVVPASVCVVLVALYHFMSTVAGPEGLAMSGLDSLPFSPAAEVMVGAALLVVSWLLTGLWPLQRWSPGPLVAPGAAILLARVGLVAAPGGLEHWRTIAALLAMLGIWHAAASGWSAGMAVGGAWLALISLDPSGIVAAAWLLPSAVVLDLAGGERAESSPRYRWSRDVAWMAAGWGGLLAIGAGLHGEVVYTMLSAAGAILLMASPRQAMTASDRSSTAPSA